MIAGGSKHSQVNIKYPNIIKIQNQDFSSEKFLRSTKIS
jgi:hypothetical protein